MKTILLVVSEPFSVQYLLRTSIFQTLARSGHQIWVASSHYQNETFGREFSRFQNVELVSNFEYEIIQFDRSSPLKAFFLYWNSFGLELSEFEKENQRKKQNLLTGKQNICIRICRKIGNFVIPALRGLTLFRKVLARVEDRLAAPQFLTEFILSSDVDLVVTTTLGLLPVDKYFLRAAVQSHIPAICVCLSWDNTTAKSTLFTQVSKVIVWNELIKEQLVRQHQFDPKIIEAKGIAHLEIYCDDDRLDAAKKLVSSELHLNGLPLILIASGSPTCLHSLNLHIIRKLGRALKNKRFPECEIVLRVHPLYLDFISAKGISKKQLQELQKTADEAGIVIYIPSKEFDDFGSEFGFDQYEHEMIFLAGLMKKANVLIDFCSNIMLEAAFMDVPIINIAYDLPETKNCNQLLMNAPHIRRILSYDATVQVESEDQLINEINNALLNPQLKRSSRSNLVEHECPVASGTGAEIANMILESS